MSLDPNQVVDDSASVAKVAVSEGKKFWKSKTFWANVALAGLHYTGNLPPKAAVPVAVGANLLLRYLTNQPLVF